jgi:DUF1009 family protein
MIKLSPNKAIGIVVGGGNAPKLLVKSLEQQHINCFILAIEGDADPELLISRKHQWVSLGEFKKIFKALKENNVSHVSFIGSISRPSITSLKLDSKAIFTILKFGMKSFLGGDNKLLTTVLQIFEGEGYKIISPEKITPELIAPKGVLGKVKPSKSDMEDVEIGVKVLETLGMLDVGQAVVVENRYILGIEAAEGTSNLIKRSKLLKKETKPYGVLVKMKKSSQDMRIDLPSIGVQTIEELKNSGLRGIAIKSGESFIIDIKDVIKQADKNKIFILGI